MVYKSVRYIKKKERKKMDEAEEADWCYESEGIQF